MDDTSLQECFLLGVSIAQYVNDNVPSSERGKPGAIFRTLKEVADGSTTLLDSWAEFKRRIANADENLIKATEACHERARASERAMAVRVVAAMPEEVFGGQ
jgi:hypothetical protein